MRRRFALLLERVPAKWPPVRRQGRAPARKPGAFRGSFEPRKALAAVGAILCLAAASDPAERLRDPAEEAHARALFSQIRCVQCQSESIDDSEAPLAHDLRQIVREQVAAKRSDAEIKRYLVDRYGEFVLLKPSFAGANAALWLIPLLAALAGAAGFAVYVRRRSEAPEPGLSPEEEVEVHNLVARHAFAATGPQENTQDDLSVS